jgi:hypothetical protein
MNHLMSIGTPVAAPSKVWNKRDPNCPADAVYVGRPTKWGNPFSHLSSSAARYRVASRQEAVDAYRTMLLAAPHLLKDLHELRGKDLVCWCAPAACHADVLLEIANA